MNVDSAASVSTPLTVRESTRSAASQPEDRPEATASALPAEQAGTFVELSDAGKAKAASETLAAEATDSASDDSGSTDEPVKHAQSFVYGALGLERPEEKPKNENSFYTAGKWVSAVATAGMFVSLLV